MKRRLGNLASFASALLVVGAITCARSARADVEACVGFHERGQTEHNTGKLLSARADFISCASADCPELVRGECQQFLAQVEAQLASAVFAARDANGNPASDVSVMVDGQVVLERLTGTATSLDPGQHTVVYTWPDGHQQTQSLVLQIGQRDMVLTLRREPGPSAVDEAPREPAPSRSVPTLAYVLGGVGVAALGTFAGFALAGRSTESELDRCKPHCTRDKVDAMRSRYLVADIALAVGVVSLGAGTYVYLNAAGSREPEGPRAASVAVRGVF